MKGYTRVDSHLAFLNPQNIPHLYPQIVDVYRAALASPPYEMQEDDVQRFSDTLLLHASRQGFQGYAAYSSKHHHIIGFIYGYTSRPGLWWRDIVSQALGPQQTAQWLDQAFELVELAVHPRSQGQGIGAQLHDTLLHNLPYRTAILSTAQAETVAQKMYQRRGWVTLQEDFFFPGAKIPYRIMGLLLSHNKGL